MVIDIIALCLSGVAICLSFCSFKYSKGSIETGVMTIFFEERKNFDLTVLEYENYISDIEKDETKEAYWYERYKRAYVSYLNVVDYLCTKFNCGEIRKRVFKTVMKDELKRLMSKEFTKKLFNYDRKIEDWEEIVMAYNKVNEEEK